MLNDEDDDVMITHFSTAIDAACTTNADCDAGANEVCDADSQNVCRYSK